MRALSPKDTKCTFCGKYFTRRGLLEHQRHHCAKNPHRRPRVFKKTRCKHCGKEMHGNGLRVHVASVHPEAYARARSVKAHRMKENPFKRSGNAGVKKEVGKKKHSRQHEASNHALHSREDSSAPRKPRKEHKVMHAHDRRESRAETTERIWEEVRKRTPLLTRNRKPSGNWRRGDQETA